MPGISHSRSLHDLEDLALLDRGRDYLGDAIAGCMPALGSESEGNSSGVRLLRARVAARAARRGKAVECGRDRKDEQGVEKGADEGLKQVMSSPGLDLIEFSLAREILGGARAQVGGPVPEVGLP